MISIAKLKYLRIAPRKVRLVTDLIRGKTAKKAEKILTFTRKRAALPILKLLNQAVANAKNNFQVVDENNLYISKILVDEGTKLKRQLPRARGRADIIQKKTSHITLVLDEIDKTKKKKKIEKKIKPKVVKEEVLKEKEKEEETKEVVEKKTRQKFEPERIKAEKQKGLKRFFRRKAF
jgi:large subunit ribosomal protein L22